MNKPSCFDKAAQLLAVRPHFRRELERKLVTRGYQRLEVEATLDRLGELGYLDDKKFAGAWVEARLARGGVGRLRLRADLQRKGVDTDLVSEVLAERLPEDDLPAAREAAEGWRRRRSGGRSRGSSEGPALARHLERKGFSRRAIFSVLKEIPEGEDPGQG